MNGKTIIIGASGQIGTELLIELRKQKGADNIIATDIRSSNNPIFEEGPFEQMDVLDKKMLRETIEKYNVEEVYLLAALLSATAEKKPIAAWQLNMEGLFNILNLAKEGIIKKIFWPSSIAVFGPSSPKINTPQYTIMEPTTVYGISKSAGEQWCNYYFSQYGVDVRSIRYPGLIGYGSAPGGGTTDYAVDIFYKAIHDGHYECFLSEDTRLPMMYMPDAISATLALMNAPADELSIRTSYNLGGISFTPREISNEIKKHIPSFKITYNPDFRESIAQSWPYKIDDSVAKRDWNWNHQFNLAEMVKDMLLHIN